MNMSAGAAKDILGVREFGVGSDSMANIRVPFERESDFAPNALFGFVLASHNRNLDGRGKPI